MIEEIIEFDEEHSKVLVTNPNYLDPNGNPIIIEYTVEEWNHLQVN